MDKSELILNNDGSVYHLKLKPEDLSSKVILVGDPFRVDKIVKHFESIEIIAQIPTADTATTRLRHKIKITFI